MSELNSGGVFIHPTAIVDAGARFGDNTKIWHFCHIMGGVDIGEDCSFGQNVFVAEGVNIGNNVKVQNNVSIYSGVTIEDDVFCGPSMVFTNVLTPRSHVSRKDEYAKTLVKKGASIGANAVIVCGHDIGEYAMIGAGAVITKSVKPYALMLGNPAVQKGWVCKCGEILKMENGKATCHRCSAGYEETDGELIEK